MIRKVAVIGSGAGGSYAALRLARDGFEVDLFESHPDKEKACGGGVTGLTWELIPELSEIDADAHEVRRLRFLLPSGTRCEVGLSAPVRIYQRSRLDGALRQKALDSGAKLHVRRVQKFERVEGRWLIDGAFEADFLIGAGGLSCPVRRRLVGPVDAQVTHATGYFVPGNFDPVIDVRFYRNLKGYLWWFPRKTDASLGIVWDPDDLNRDKARELLREYADEFLPGVRAGTLDECPSYGGACPCLPPNAFYTRTYQEDGAALIGDAAGLCDPITGEGIRHAFHSAKLLCDALKRQEPKRYYPMLARAVLPELDNSARARHKFYRNWFISLGFGMAARSPTMKQFASAHAFGGVTVHETMSSLVRNKYRIVLEALRPFRKSPS